MIGKIFKVAVSSVIVVYGVKAIVNVVRSINKGDEVGGGFEMVFGPGDIEPELINKE